MAFRYCKPYSVEGISLIFSLFQLLLQLFSCVRPIERAWDPIFHAPWNAQILDHILLSDWCWHSQHWSWEVSLGAEFLVEDKCSCLMLVRQTSRKRFLTKVFYETFALHIKKLRANQFCLDNLSLFSFVDYVWNETKFHTAKKRITRDIIKVGNSDQWRKKLSFMSKESEAMLIKVSTLSARFNALREVTFRACLRRISIETFFDIIQYRVKYRLDKRVISSGFHTSSNYDDQPAFQ